MSKYNRAKYYNREPNRKRYAIGYECSLPDGTIVMFDDVKSLSKFTGYSESSLKHMMSGKWKPQGMNLKRVYN